MMRLSPIRVISMTGSVMNSSPMRGRNSNMTGISAQCMAHIVEAEKPSMSSFDMVLCSCCGSIWCFSLIAIHLQNGEFLQLNQSYNNCKRFAKGKSFFNREGAKTFYHRGHGAHREKITTARRKNNH